MTHESEPAHHDHPHPATPDANQHGVPPPHTQASPTRSSPAAFRSSLRVAAPSALLTLQRLIGNQAVQKLLPLSRIQRQIGAIGTQGIGKRVKQSPSNRLYTIIAVRPGTAPGEIYYMLQPDEPAGAAVEVAGTSDDYTLVEGEARADAPTGLPRETTDPPGGAPPAPTPAAPLPTPAAGAHLAPGRILAAQPGLWESISGDTKNPNVPQPLIKESVRVKKEPPTITIELEVKDQSGAQGLIETSYNPLIYDFVLNWIHTQNIPAKFVHTTPALVPGKGTPLSTYLILRSMKLHKMGGPIKEFRVEHIEEIRAVCEYNAALRRGLAPESPDLLQALHPVLYAQTPLLQAGYQIASIKIAGGQKVPLLQAISNMAGRTWKGEKKTKVDPAKLQHYEEVARHYGFDPTIGSEVILFGFHVDMRLTPPIPK